MHGVDPGRIQPVADEDVEGGKVVASGFEEPTDDINPVPVRIVGAAATEWKQFRVYQATITNTPTMVVSQKVGRSLAQIRLIGPTIYRTFIGPDSGVSPSTGYPLAQDGDEFSSTTESAIWAICAPGEGPATVAVHTEFATPQ